jgi:Ring hydroxylating beta subunit
MPAYFERTALADPIDEMRVARLDTRMAWAEDPPSRTGHVVGNLKAVLLENGKVETKTAFLVYRSHRETGSSAPLRLPRGRAAQDERRVEGEQAAQSCSPPTFSRRRTSASSFKVTPQTPAVRACCLGAA